MTPYFYDGIEMGGLLFIYFYTYLIFNIFNIDIDDMTRHLIQNKTKWVTLSVQNGSGTEMAYGLVN